MKKSVTMKDIANKLNVSVVTVSKALGGKEGVSDELKNRIVACAEEMGYRLNSLAKSMRDGYSHNIGVIVSERFIGNTQSFYPIFHQYLSQKLGEYGYSVIIKVLSLSDENQLVLPRAYYEKKIDGLIVLGQIDVSYANLLDKSDIPVVLLDFYDERIDIDSVVTDNFFGSYEITSYLIKNGHRSISFIGNIYATSSIQDRFLGYFKALLGNGMCLREDQIISDRDSNGKYIEILLPENMPTAFVCNNDEIAFNLIAKLKVIGYDVPGDISVVGFDNSVHSSLSVPGITTMSVHVEQMAETASKIIVKKIQKPNTRYGRVTIKGNLLSRDSVRNISR